MTTRPLHIDAESGELPQHESEPDLVQIRRDMAFFNREKPSFLNDPEFAGKFVAVLNGKVVDRDHDEFALVERVCAMYPDDPVFIGHVTAETPAVELSSPEVAWSGRLHLH